MVFNGRGRYIHSSSSTNVRFEFAFIWVVEGKKGRWYWLFEVPCMSSPRRVAGSALEGSFWVIFLVKESSGMRRGWDGKLASLQAIGAFIRGLFPSKQETIMAVTKKEGSAMKVV